MRIKSTYSLILIILFSISLNGFCQTPAIQSSSATSAASTATYITDPIFDGLKYKSQTRKLNLSDGQIIAYTDEGKSNETIIFIHGLGSYLSAWDKNIPELSTKYRTVALDLPGYGKSSKVNAKVSMAYYAKVVLELMDKLNLKKAILMGHSMGGQVAITTALLAPKRVSKLILAAPAGLEIFTEQQKQIFKLKVTPESIRQLTPEQITANYKANFYNMPEDTYQMLNERLLVMKSEQFTDYCEAVASSVAAMVDEPVQSKLWQLKMPVLIMFGYNDDLIPNKYYNPTLSPKDVADIGKELIPNCQTIILPEAGHFLQYEQPVAFNKAVIKFLNKKMK